MDLQGGPTFEDLSINDELSQLQRVVRYTSSSIALQRLVHVKMLAETVAAVGFEETVKSVVPLLGPLAEDQELVVRQHLGEQLDEIARFCRASGKDGGYRLIIEIVLPTLAKLLGDPQGEVRQAAGESLVGVASLMKPLDLGHYVLTIVLQLAHDDEQEELRMTAAALLNDLAESLGNDLCEQFVTPEMESLSEDPVFRVRKATALNLHKICKVVGEAGIQRLLLTYIRLTKDDVYRVRKACTEALVEMSKAVGAEMSLRELTPVFLNLASDSSKIVRTGALQHLGRLISTLPGESVSEELVRYFTGTAVESMGDPVADAELRLYCAFSFPAVVITVGPNRWGEVRESFAALLRDPSWAVRKTLSHSLHEVAKVLMPEDVECDLVPAMEAFLRDMEDVRLGVIRHLGDFFEQMSPHRREKHLNVLVEILQTTSPFNWRLREVLAQQLPRLAPLLTLDSVFFSVVPVAFGLLNDPVAVVREKTFEVVAPLLQLAGAHSGARQASMVSRVRELAHAHTYQARQMYVYICHSMACSANTSHERPLFIQEFVPSLAELARDSVVNVRIAMSRTLSKCPDWVMELPDIRRAIKHLVRDSNPDVRHFVSFLPPILSHDLSQEDKVPCVDTSSVLSDESVLTQWSVSTQRSMLSVGDFPPLRDASSPSSSSRSFKLGRQRSSSMESAGESGNSTTSSEGEGLKRLSSRRPPLPSGWGLPTPGSSPGSAFSPPRAPSSGAPGGVGGAAATAAEKAEGSISTQGGGVVSTSSEDVVWGASVGDSGARAGGGGKANGVEDEGENDENRAEGGVPVPAGEAAFEGQGAGGGVGDGDGLLFPPPTKRAVSQDATVLHDGALDDPLIPPIVVDPSADGPSPTNQIVGLSLADQAETLAEVNQEGMLPPTPVPSLAAGGLRAGPFAIDLAAPVASPRRGSLSGRPFEEHSPVWTGDDDDDDIDEEEGASGEGNATDAAAAESSTAAPAGDAENGAPADGVIRDSPPRRDRLNLTPPPWDASVRDREEGLAPPLPPAGDAPTPSAATAASSTPKPAAAAATLASVAAGEAADDTEGAGAASEEIKRDGDSTGDTCKPTSASASDASDAAPSGLSSSVPSEPSTEGKMDGDVVVDGDAGSTTRALAAAGAGLASEMGGGVGYLAAAGEPKEAPLGVGQAGGEEAGSLSGGGGDGGDSPSVAAAGSEPVGGGVDVAGLEQKRVALVAECEDVDEVKSLSPAGVGAR